MENFGIDIKYFQKLLKDLNEEKLEQITQFAKAQGISQENISSGISTIKELKNGLKEDLL